MKVYYNNLVLGEIENKKNLEIFLREKFREEEELIFRGYEEVYPIWAEWYESIILTTEGITNNYIKLNEEWYVDKDYIILKKE